MPISDAITATRYGQPKMWVRDNSSGCWTSEQVLPVSPFKGPAAEHLQSTQPQQQQEPLSSEQVMPVLAPAAEHVQSTQPEQQQELLSSERHTEAEQPAAAEAASAVVEDSVQDELLRRSLVLVEVEIPHVALMDGVHAKSFAGHTPHLTFGFSAAWCHALSWHLLQC